jgi:hypothetical protein
MISYYNSFNAPRQKSQIYSEGSGGSSGRHNPSFNPPCLWNHRQTTHSRFCSDSDISLPLPLLFIVLRVGVRFSPLGTSTSNWLIVRAPHNRWVWSILWNENCRQNWSTREKSDPVPLCPPQIQHNLTLERTRAAAVEIRRLRARAMAPWLDFTSRHLHSSFVSKSFLSPYFLC